MSGTCATDPNQSSRLKSGWAHRAVRCCAMRLPSTDLPLRASLVPVLAGLACGSRNHQFVAGQIPLLAGRPIHPVGLVPRGLESSQSPVEDGLQTDRRRACAKRRRGLRTLERLMRCTTSSIFWRDRGSPVSTIPAKRIHGLGSSTRIVARTARRNSSASEIPSRVASRFAALCSASERLLCTLAMHRL